MGQRRGSHNSTIWCRNSDARVTCPPTSASMPWLWNTAQQCHEIVGCQVPASDVIAENGCWQVGVLHRVADRQFVPMGPIIVRTGDGHGAVETSGVAQKLNLGVAGKHVGQWQLRNVHALTSQIVKADAISARIKRHNDRSRSEITRWATSSTPNANKRSPFSSDALPTAMIALAARFSP